MERKSKSRSINPSTAKVLSIFRRGDERVWELAPPDAKRIICQCGANAQYGRTVNGGAPFFYECRECLPSQYLTPASPTAIGGSSERICFACDRRLGRNPHVAVTSEGQIVKVGSECFKQITPSGFHPPKGGPVLYRGRFSPSGQLVEIIKA